MLAEAIAVAAAAAGVLAIGERVRVMVKRVTLRPFVLLRVGVFVGEEVLVGGGSIVVWVGIV